MGWKKLLPYIGQPSVPFYGAIATMSRPTKKNAAVRKSCSWTGCQTKLKESTVEPTMSTKLYNTLSSNPSFGIWCDCTGTVRRTIPPNYPTTYPITFSMCTDGDSKEKRKQTNGSILSTAIRHTRSSLPPLQSTTLG